MDEDVLAAAIRRDETETTVVVEKLDGAVLAHGETFPLFERLREDLLGADIREVNKKRKAWLFRATLFKGVTEISLTGFFVMSRTAQRAPMHDNVGLSHGCGK
ncbi:MAG: hypothetical protein AAFY24_21830 [Pseudomonadota bacterium]